MKRRSPGISSLKALALGLLSMFPAPLTSLFSAQFSPWQEGYLDIYHLALGTGVSTFSIFPDGTTLLIDAGDLVRERPPAYDSPPLPDGSRRSGEWIEAWIRTFYPRDREAHIDYALISHFHGDHYGTITEASPASHYPGAPYRLSGFTDVFDRLPLRQLIDRHGHGPDTPGLPADATFLNYLAFREFHSIRNSIRVAAVEVGSRDQIRPVNDPGTYPGFNVWVIAANGLVRSTGSPPSRPHFPPGTAPNENAFSIVLRLDYGPFSYFTGGDLPGVLQPHQPTWQDMESAVAWEVGPVDVHVVNHHGFRDASNPFFLSVLRPQVHILTPYAASHPSPEVWDRLMSPLHYSGPRSVFSTLGMWEGRFPHMVQLFGEAGASKVRNHLLEGHPNGHILVRVYPGGKEFEMMVLELSTDPAVLYQERYTSRAGL